MSIHPTFAPIAIWTIVGASLLAILFRPRGVAPWVAAVAGALALVLFGLLSPTAAARAIARGDDVYLFLGGMMVLAEIARGAGVFDWIAAGAVRASHGSAFRLFVLIFGACVAVTIVLSNDATAVVLTPAVAAAAARARARPLPYLYACAFVANAASFVLPISNPANLVIFGGALPSLATWIALFALPSLAAILATFGALAIVSRDDLHGSIERPNAVARLSRAGRVASGGIALAASALVVASFRGAALGATTASAALVVFVAVALTDRGAVKSLARDVSWSVIALVAGLFVFVAAIDRTGFLGVARAALLRAGASPPSLGIAAVGLVTAAASNIANNLPIGLLAGFALASTPHARAIASATAIGVDLGPNLSINGSLATLLWLVALRREGIAIDALAFLRIGALVVTPALLLALGALTLVAR